MNKITIITGHYGSGKTTLAINTALLLKEKGKQVTIIDLDVINPFFRTSEYKELLEQNDIKTILPTQAGTTTDMPALSPQISSMFTQSDMHYILDVGGDDVGATVLGQYASRLDEVGYDMFYVVNKYRYMTQTVTEAVCVLNEIEFTSRLKATGIINNSNLGIETTQELIENSVEFAKELSQKVNLPIIPNFNNIQIFKQIGV